MKSAEQIVVDHGHSKDRTASVAERIALYRAFASTTSSTAIAAHFFNCADELAAAEERVGQRTLDFGRSFDGNGRLAQS